MTQPSKTHKNDYAKTDAQLYGNDGTGWIAVSIDGDGFLSCKNKAWDASTLSFVDLQVNAAGELKVTGASSPEALAIYEDGDATYICKAPLGSGLSDAVWQIKLLDEGAVPTQILWCDGNASFDNTATDLATVRGHSYS